jgi:ParB-like chromosome segregation protein Spo0J
MKTPKNATAAFYTEALFAKHGNNLSGKAGEIYDIHTDAFFNSVYLKEGFNPRHSEFGSDEEDIMLLDAVKNGAVLPPLEIFKDDSGKFFVVSGHRRFKALERAILEGAAIKKIAVRILPAKNPKTGLKYTEADLLALSIGQNRGKSLTHSEMSDTVIRLKKFGWKTEDIMTALSLSKNQVSQYSVLSQGTEKLKKAVDAGTGNRSDGIGFVDAVDAVRKYADEPEKQNEVVEKKAEERKAGRKKPEQDNVTEKSKFKLKKQTSELWLVYEKKKFSGFIQRYPDGFAFVYPDESMGFNTVIEPDMNNLLVEMENYF